MRKETHAQIKQQLQNFKKGHRLPKGYTAVFHNNIDTDDLYGNTTRTAGKKIGTTKVYHSPFYDIIHNSESAFCIEALEDGKISVFGESDATSVTTWEEALKAGLEYEEIDHPTDTRPDTEWVEFNEEGFAGLYRVKDGALLQAPQCDAVAEEPVDEDDVVHVEYLVSGEREMKFLETINERLGSDFEYSEFSE